MLIFDIGCNKGEFIRACLEKYNKPDIVAIDANVDMLAHCTKRFGLNHKIAYQYAVISDKIGQEDFYLSTETGISTASKDWISNSRFAKGSASLAPHSSQWNPFPIKVRSLTLDRLIELYGEPDLIKIDVEGYEYKVALGLTKKVGEIQFEWAEEERENILKTVEYLRSIGYTDFGVRGHILELVQLVPVEYKSSLDKNGDTHLEQPRQYYSYDEIVEELKIICKSERRVNWGMIHAR